MQDDAFDDILWGAEAIAAYIKRGPRQTYYLIHTKRVPAKKIGATWVASRSKLRERLLGEHAAVADKGRDAA